MNDLRFALRQLRKTPGFTFIAVLTLALGIGANTAIFSVIYAVLLQPLPYPEASKLVILTETDSHQPQISVSYPNYLDWKRDQTVFEHVAVSRRESFNMSGLEGRAPEQISGGLVTGNFFKVIGLTPQLGRVFTEEEDRVGGPMVCVISDKLWQRVFNRDPGILGKAVNFGNQPYTILGVMPPQMFSPRTVDVWFPLTRRTDDQMWHARDNHPGLYGWGRLKDGVTAEQALAQMKEIAGRLAVQYPQSNTGISVTVTPLLENQVGDYRGSLKLLLGAVALVLLIACANLANLLAARGAARAREFAVRAAVGASRWQIIRQLLIESFVLAIAGGLLGLCLAAWGRDLLVALAPPGVPRFQNISLNNWVLLFSLGLSFGTSVLFGLWPAWHTSRADIQLALKSGGGHGSSEAPGARRSRDLLVIAEVALTLVLLSTAGLVLKSFANARNLGLGFDPQLLLSARIDLPEPTYSDGKKLINFTEALLQKLSALPGVQNAAVASNPPLMTGWQTSFLPEGMPEPEPGKAPAVEMAIATEGYFQTIKTPLLRGRVFEATDTKEAPPVIIVDQLLADRYFPGQDAVGKHLKMNTGEKGAAENRTIVGVVPHLKVYGFEETTVLPQAYLPMKQQPSTALVVLLRTSLSPKSLEKPVREIVASLDPAQPAFDFKTMRERVEETWATPRLMSFLLVCFAVLALTLAIVGLYGVMAYNGLRRMREIGVRLALGAMPAQIRRMMLGQGLRLLGVGLVLGFAGSVALSRVIRSLLFGVNANDPVIYATVTVVLIAASLVACWLPARRASRVNPMITLRSE
ncbi:MAG TPA: ABC transporter permease [Chthoniobacterales bacterium]|jgi:putative ABC transport system permease protein|nr:ABC transporter permease [Chthoniobacterales bacterium]